MSVELVRNILYGVTIALSLGWIVWVALGHENRKNSYKKLSAKINALNRNKKKK